MTTPWAPSVRNSFRSPSDKVGSGYPRGLTRPTASNPVRPAPKLAQDWTEAVGSVPIVRLNNIATAFTDRECYLKLESCNPGGSIKEKNAVCLVNDAERRGLLAPGGTIIESSSGNFGLALAMVGALRGYRVILVVDAKTTPPFRRMLRAHGAELIEVGPECVDSSGSMQQARIQRATDLAHSISGSWYVCQHHNPMNPQAHSQYTAREIINAFPGGLDYLVVGVSTGGQLSGLARHLLPRFPNLRIVAVDVDGSTILGGEAKPYKMTGIGLSFRPPNLDYASIDRGYIVPEDLAYSTCHAIARREGLLMGSSTGAIVAAAIHLTNEIPKGSRVCLIGPDRGDRYLETVYEPAWLEKNGFTLTPPLELEKEIMSRLNPTLVS